MHSLFWRAKYILLVLLFLSAAAVAGDSVRSGLRFAALPMESQHASLSLFQPMVDRLQQSGHPVELLWYRDYQAILNDFVSGNIDLAVLGPLGYLHLRERSSQAQPLLRFREPGGKAHYRCALVSFAGDDISLNTLAEQSIGLTQPLSTCGYFGTAAILRNYGIDIAEQDYAYLGNHEEVALAVIAGEVAVGGVKEEFAIKYAVLGLQVLALSEEVPALVLVANAATLSEMVLKKIRDTLLSTPEGIYLRWGGGFHHGMLMARDSDYDKFRQFGDWRDIPYKEMKYHD